MGQTASKVKLVPAKDHMVPSETMSLPVFLTTKLLQDEAWKAENVVCFFPILQKMEILLEITGLFNWPG